MDAAAFVDLYYHYFTTNRDQLAPLYVRRSLPNFPEFPVPLTRSWRSILTTLIARRIHAHLRGHSTPWCEEYHEEAQRESHNCRSAWRASDCFSLTMIKQGLPFKIAAYQISSTDAQPTMENCLKVLVTGSLSVRLPCIHVHNVINEPLDPCIFRLTETRQ